MSRLLLFILWIGSTRSRSRRMDASVNAFVRVRAKKQRRSPAPGGETMLVRYFDLKKGPR